MTEYSRGFKAGIEKAESVILAIESRLYADLKASGMKYPTVPATPVLRQIIKEMKEGVDYE